VSTIISLKSLVGDHRGLSIEGAVQDCKTVFDASADGICERSTSL